MVLKYSIDLIIPFLGGVFLFLSIQEKPIPKILSPGVVSNNESQWNNYFHTKDSIGFFTKWEEGKSRIMTYPYINGAFHNPKPMPFDDRFNYADPWISVDGKHMMFQANIGSNGQISKEYQLFESFFINQKWSKPEPLVIPNAMKGNKGCPVLTHSGNLYFTALSGHENYDIFMLRKGSDTPEPLGTAINSRHYEGGFYMDPNENFIVFSSANRSEGIGKSDLYVSFRKNGIWQPSRRLDNSINSSEEEISPYITEDGKFLIFTSNREAPYAMIPKYNHYYISIDLPSWERLHLE